jgi:ankyrin repeat protein
LIKIGFDPKARDNQALILAAVNNNLEIVKFLVEVGCDPKARDNEAIIKANRDYNFEIIDYLKSYTNHQS